MGAVSVRPYSWMNSHCSSVSICSMMDVGGGAPATMMRTRSRPGMTPSQFAAASSTAVHTAGAPPVSVTPCLPMRRRISGPSILRWTICVTPIALRLYGMAHASQ